MSLLALPVELLDATFEPLSAATLAVLARTSHHLSPRATRLLYRHLSLSSVAHNLSAVHTLAAHPHLSSLVRRFAITIQDGAGDVDTKYYIQLSQAMQGMQDLASLDVHIDATLSWVLPKLLPTTVLSQLLHFACSFALDKNVAAFLACTPSLRSLQIAPSPDAVVLRQSDIPKLKTYTGPPNLLCQLLPSRPLTSLHLSGDLSVDDIEYFTNSSSALIHTGTHEYPNESGILSTAAIETLSAVTSAQPVPVVEALAHACPNLVSLQVIATCAFWQTLDMTVYTRVASALSLMPRLCSFELSGMHWEFRPKSTLTTDGTRFVKEWISPPVTPRPDALEPLNNTNDLDFEEAFLEWAY